MVTQKTVPGHLIVIFTSEPSGHAKSITNLNSLDSSYPHHGSGNKRVQLAKDRVSKAGRASAGSYLNDAPDRITRLLRRHYFLFEFTRIRVSMDVEDFT